MNGPSHVGGLQTYQTFLYRKALHPELFALKARRTIAHNAYELEIWLTPGGHAARFRHGQFACCELVTDNDDRLPMEGAVTGFPCAGEHEFEHRFAAERVTYITSVQTETLSENLYNATYEEMVDFAKQTGALVYAWSDAPTLNGFAALNGSAATPAAKPHQNGHANGLANGHTNGYTNGHGNGTTNGHANGHANGYANGSHTNGHIGGKPNGNGASMAGQNGRGRPAMGGRLLRGSPGNLSLMDVQKLSKEVHCHSYHLIASQGLVLRTQTIFEHA